MKKLILIVIALLSSLLSITIVDDSKANSESQKNQFRVKTTRYWTSPIIRDYQVENLAKVDLLIVDLENMFNNYYNLVKIKELNPDIKLLCYSNPMEIYLTKFNNRPWQNKIIDEIINERPEWLLRKEGGFPTFWPNMAMLNMSSSCPRVSFRRYSPWMARKLNREILSDTIWDGYFMDNATPNISWVDPGSIDINNNGNADPDELVNKLWERGVSRFLRMIRRANGDDFIIIGNKGDHAFLDVVDGKMFENFPNNWLGDTWANGWLQSMNNAKRTGKYTVFTVSRNDIIFGLASSMLLDNVYLSVAQDNYENFEHFHLDLGQPIRPMENYRNKIFFRNFEKGIVYVYPKQRKGEIIFFDKANE